MNNPYKPQLLLEPYRGVASDILRETLLLDIKSPDGVKRAGGDVRVITIAEMIEFSDNEYFQSDMEGALFVLIMNVMAELDCFHYGIHQPLMIQALFSKVSEEGGGGFADHTGRKFDEDGELTEQYVDRKHLTNRRVLSIKVGTLKTDEELDTILKGDWWRCDSIEEAKTWNKDIITMLTEEEDES